MSYPPPPGGDDPYQQPQQPPQPGQPPYGQPAYGQPQTPGYGYGPPAPAPAPTSSKATTSLVLGIVSLVMCGLLTGIPAIFVGMSARKEIKESQGRVGGDGAALGGIITGALGTLWSIALIIFLVVTLVFVGEAAQEIGDEVCRELARDADPNNDC